LAACLLFFFSQPLFAVTINLMLHVPAQKIVTLVKTVNIANTALKMVALVAFVRSKMAGIVKSDADKEIDIGY